MIKRDYENVKKVFADLTDEELDSLFDLIMFGDGFYECPVALKQAFADAPVQFDPPTFETSPVTEKSVKAFHDYVDAEKREPNVDDWEQLFGKMTFTSKKLPPMEKTPLKNMNFEFVPTDSFADAIRLAIQAANRVNEEEFRRKTDLHWKEQIISHIRNAYKNNVKWDSLRNELRQDFDMSAEDAGDIARIYLKEAMDLISEERMWQDIKKELNRMYPGGNV